MIRLGPTIALLLLVSAPGPVRGEVDEFAFTAGAGAWLASATLGDADVFSAAPHAHAAIRYGLSDFWQLGGSLDLGVALSGDHDPAFVGMAHLEAYYFLDIIEWVLFGAVGVGAIARGQHPDQLLGTSDATLVFDLSAHVGIGLDYRPARDWAVGVLGRYQFIVTDLDRSQPVVDVSLGYTIFFE